MKCNYVDENGNKLANGAILAVKAIDKTAKKIHLYKDATTYVLPFEKAILNLGYATTSYGSQGKKKRTL